MNRTLFWLVALATLFGCAPKTPAPSAALAWRPKPPVIAPATEKRRKKPAPAIAPGTLTQAPSEPEPTATSDNVPPAPVASTAPAVPVAPSPADAVAQDYVRAAEFLQQYRTRLPCAGPDTGPPLLCKDPGVEQRLQNAVTDAAPPVIRATTQRGDETKVKAAADVAAAAVQPLNDIVVPLAK